MFNEKEIQLLIESVEGYLFDMKYAMVPQDQDYLKEKHEKEIALENLLKKLKER